MELITTQNFSAQRLSELASSVKTENTQFFKKLKRLDPGKVDSLFHSLHAEEFEKFDCLVCANCCRTISPIITYNDIERLSRGLKQKPSLLVTKFMVVDTDGDYVFRTSPCPFLLPDNYCTAYEHRPKACREYPHTNRKRMAQILNIILKNISVCPIVFNVVEKMKAQG